MTAADTETCRCVRLPSWLAIAALVCVAAMPVTGRAFELKHAEAQYVDEEYRFEMTADIDAPAADVERILRSYEDYKLLDARILEAHVIERSEAQHFAVLSTTLRACVGPICRNVKRIERVEESPLELLAITDPTRSDMKFGETRMQLAATEEARTRVTYHTRLQPDFWIPALIARRIMLTTLEDATIELFRNVEKRAQRLAEERSRALSSSPAPDDSTIH
jgi:hypothetical protein